MASAYLQRIGTAVPEHDIHEKFVHFAADLLSDPRAKAIFRRLASRSGIQHRYSCLGSQPSGGINSTDAFTVYGSGTVPTTRRRMEIFEQSAPALLRKSLDQLRLSTDELKRVKHVIVTCCTGLYAPGLDFEILDYLNLPASTERVMIGFMGCYAAINALRTARHIVRSNPEDAVLIVSLELCTLHFHRSQDMNDILSFLLFADGCASALVNADAGGFELDAFETLQFTDTRDSITWRVGDLGFDMYLSTQVPQHIAGAMRQSASRLLEGSSVDLWAVHPGGRAILDAVEAGLGLDPAVLAASRKILQEFGNMSSATVLFVLRDLLLAAKPGQSGCAMSFGPGLTAEIMRFHGA
jgi:predicted naringenin-chalcone synthase